MVADPMGHLLAFFAAVAMLASIAYAQPYLATRDMLKGEFFTLALFVYLGISVMVSANNFLVIYLGLELMSLSLYALTALRRDHAVSTEAAMKYFVLGALASGFLLYGLSMMYGATGSLDLGEVFKAIAAGSINKEVLTFGIVFVVAGLGLQARRRALPHVGARRVPRRADGGHAAHRRCAEAGGLRHHHPAAGRRHGWAWRWTGSRCSS